MGFAFWFFLLASVPIGAHPNANALPAEWHGRWQGTLRIQAVSGRSLQVPMELTIGPQPEGDAYQWTITYGAGEKKDARRYLLRPVGEEAGKFLMDEQNGIELDARLMGATLFSHFRVGDSLLTARYALREKRLSVEITAYAAGQPRSTGKKEGTPEVQSYPLLTVQTAELKRSEAAPEAKRK